MFLLLSTSDTDLLSARAANGRGDAPISWRYANPARLLPEDLPDLLEGTDLVVVRLLGGRRAWEDGLDVLLPSDPSAQSRPVVVLTGEQAPDADLMSASTVPAGVAAQAHAYLAHGGAGNLAQLAAFLSDTVLLTGYGFEAPASAPSWGSLGCTGSCAARPAGERPACGQPTCRAWTSPATDADGRPRPTVAILYYRAHQMSGNTGFVTALADAVESAGGRALPLYVASLRTCEPELLDVLRGADAVVTTVLAAGGVTPAAAQAGGEDDAWDAGALAGLDVPIIQAFALTNSRADWLANDDGVSPLDAATQIAVPEFDGRIVTVPFSFKEVDPDDPAGLPRYVPDPERCARVAGIAVAHARLRHTPVAERRIALVLSAYPTKHARIGNAVGLDTPASTLRLLWAMHEAGYDIGPTSGPDALPGLESGNGDELIAAIIARGGYDQAWLTDEELAANPLRVPVGDYHRWFAEVDPQLRAAVEERWGPAPGDLYVDAGQTRPAGGRPGVGGSAGSRQPDQPDQPGQPAQSGPAGREDKSGPAGREDRPAPALVYAGLQAGNVVLFVQPPRGFGENPIAIYHDPELPPTHHYLGIYRWLQADQTDGGFGADAVVHIGKHGNLEWLPGKGAALGPGCAPDAVLGHLPLVYPFLVNDPGEGTQAKRRAHAVLVDHLVPPMTRADSYGDIARLEQLLDEYGTVAVMDPAKAPAVQQQIWTLLHAAKLDHDLGLTGDAPDGEGFDELVLHVDGWLCEIKDVQIRGGLHILGQAPVEEARVALVLAILQARQMWAGAVSLPGLREALGLAEGQSGRRETDDTEALARELVQAMEDRGWDRGSVDEVAAIAMDQAGAAIADADPEQVAAILDFAATEVVPRLAATTDELTHVLHALDGGFVPAGPSGSPLRGLVNVLPTGRNFYAVDPRAIPSRLAYETGTALADSLIERYRRDHGHAPASVGLSLWGTSAMRTAGDDIAEALALLGIRPVWDDASRRVTGCDVIPLAELGRPRIDVTLRISGFFRDAFPHAVALLDDAIRLAAAQDEDEEMNHVRAHVQADVAAGTDPTRATRRIFGSRPGTYGAGLLELIDSRDWRTDADLAAVYATWGGYAYGRDVDGEPAAAEMTSAYRRIRVAAKNIDTREHDIADSDDYFQFHGGMIATVRSLTGVSPEAYLGDSTRPHTVATRTLVEETSRVFRARVVNPKWMEAMRRHGYKGAFEMAATVDYLFGYDATTGVVADWMYERLTAAYVLDETNREFLQRSNPWALHGMAERLLEAVDRGLWESPEAQTLEALRATYLEAEGDLEARAEPAGAGGREEKA